MENATTVFGREGLCPKGINVPQAFYQCNPRTRGRKTPGRKMLELKSKDTRAKDTRAKESRAEIAQRVDTGEITFIYKCICLHNLYKSLI